MPPEDHGAEVVGLLDVVLGLQHQVEPAGHRHAGGFHQLLAADAALQVLVVDVPHARPVLTGAGGQAVVGRQGVVQRADENGHGTGRASVGTYGATTVGCGSLKKNRL